MIMTDEAWYVVRNTSGVTGFIGSSGGGAKPFPLARHEIEPILRNMGITTNDVKVAYDVGDEVNIMGGPFVGKSGKVDAIDTDRQTARVLVDMIGRKTPIEVELIHLEKAE